MDKNKILKKYEVIKNGEQEDIKRYNELKKKVENKDIKSKDEWEEYNKLKKSVEKIQKNLPMVENLLETREKLENLRETIIVELAERTYIDDNNKTIETEKKELESELEGLMQEEENVALELKNKNLTDEERGKLQYRLNEIKTKKDLNDKKYLENSKKEQKSYDKTRTLAGMSNEELKNKAINLKIKMDVCDLYTNRLLKGQDINHIRDVEKAADFSNKEKKYNIDIEKDIKKYNCVKAKKEKINNLINALKSQQEKNEKDNSGKDKGIFKSMKANDPGTKMISVSEFEQKHPKLAAAQKWFNNIAKKITSRFSKEEIIEEKDEEKEENKEDNRRERFMKDLKFFEGVDMSKIAENGYKENQQEYTKDSKIKAIEKLIEAKEKAGNDGGTIDKLKEKLESINKGQGR